MEQRSRSDRRQRDAGPPHGCFDRRRRCERRLPNVEEGTLSDAEWQVFFGGTVRQTGDAVADRAAAVFDRVRDGH